MYDKIYTLANPMEDGDSQILNGRIFRVRKMFDGRLQFIDATNGDLLLTTNAPLGVLTKTERGISISMASKEKSPLIYRLDCLDFLLPTSRQILGLVDPKLALKIFPTEIYL